MGGQCSVTRYTVRVGCATHLPPPPTTQQSDPGHAAGHSLIVVQGEPGGPAHQRAAMPTALAAQTSVAESMQQLDAVSRGAQQRDQDNQLEQ